MDDDRVDHGPTAAASIELERILRPAGDPGQERERAAAGAGLGRDADAVRQLVADEGHRPPEEDRHEHPLAGGPGWDRAVVPVHALEEDEVLVEVEAAVGGTLGCDARRLRRVVLLEDPTAPGVVRPPASGIRQRVGPDHDRPRRDHEASGQLLVREHPGERPVRHEQVGLPGIQLRHDLFEGCGGIEPAGWQPSPGQGDHGPVRHVQVADGADRGDPPAVEEAGVDPGPIGATTERGQDMGPFPDVVGEEPGPAGAPGRRHDDVPAAEQARVAGGHEGLQVAASHGGIGDDLVERLDEEGLREDGQLRERAAVEAGVEPPVERGPLGGVGAQSSHGVGLVGQEPAPVPAVPPPLLAAQPEEPSEQLDPSAAVHQRGAGGAPPGLRSRLTAANRPVRSIAVSSAEAARSRTSASAASPPGSGAAR